MPRNCMSKIFWIVFGLVKDPQRPSGWAFSADGQHLPKAGAPDEMEFHRGTSRGLIVIG
jgi:hypothetical protein